MLAVNSTQIFTRELMVYKLKGKNKFINIRMCIDESTLKRMLVFFKIVNLPENQYILHDSNIYIVHQELLEDGIEFNFSDFLITESGSFIKVQYIKDIIDDDMENPVNIKLYNNGGRI